MKSLSQLICRIPLSFDLLFPFGMIYIKHFLQDFGGALSLPEHHVIEYTMSVCPITGAKFDHLVRCASDFFVKVLFLFVINK